MSALWLATPRLRPSASFVKLQCSPIPRVVSAMSKTLNSLGNTFPPPLLYTQVEYLQFLQTKEYQCRVKCLYCPTPGGDRSPWEHHAEHLWNRGVRVVLGSFHGDLPRPRLEHLVSTCNALTCSELAWDLGAPAQLCVKAEAAVSCQQPWRTCSKPLYPCEEQSAAANRSDGNWPVKLYGQVGLAGSWQGSKAAEDKYFLSGKVFLRSLCFSSSSGSDEGRPWVLF